MSCNLTDDYDDADDMAELMTLFITPGEMEEIRARVQIEELQVDILVLEEQIFNKFCR